MLNYGETFQQENSNFLDKAHKNKKPIIYKNGTTKSKNHATVFNSRSTVVNKFLQ